jgi:hypothetical protein
MRGTSAISNASNFNNLVNLANGITGSDIILPVENSGNISTALSTSLYTFSQQNPNGVNGLSINMQCIDSPGNTGNTYYAIRVNTDSTQIYYGNIRLTSTTLNQ